VTSEASPVRSILAVGAGFFATAILSLGGDLAFRALAPDAFDSVGRARSAGSLIIVLAYVALSGFIGAYLTARLAVQRPVAHAVALGLIALAINAVVTFFAWDTAPAWYHAATLLLIVPVAFLAGTLRELQLRPNGV
jgi:hypothetical protein